MSERAIELLNLPADSPPLLLLDLGCGSGLSGQVISEMGHEWIGLDISPAMLDIALENGEGGNLILRDLGTGLPFRPGSFDGAISVSALQWLCNADKASQNPIRRLRVFFESLFASLKRSARAVLQIYPETSQQMDLITSSALRAGFTGGVVIDYPNSAKAKKYYLTLFAGPPPQNYQQPKALGAEAEGDERSATFVDDRSLGRKRRRIVKGGGVSKPTKKSREWIMKKKEHQKMQGKHVKADSKYTGRKRKSAF